MSSADEEDLQLVRKLRISQPSEAANEYMMIPVLEFDRLCKRVEEAPPPRNQGFAGTYYALFGAAVAIGAAIPTLLVANGLSSWVAPVYIVSAAACLVLGLVLAAFDRTMSKGQRKTTADIAVEMRNTAAVYRGKSMSAEMASNTSGDVSNPRLGALGIPLGHEATPVPGRGPGRGPARRAANRHDAVNEPARGAVQGVMVASQVGRSLGMTGLAWSSG